jgi:hypothetical protein
MSTLRVNTIQNIAGGANLTIDSSGNLLPGNAVGFGVTPANAFIQTSAGNTSNVPIKLTTQANNFLGAAANGAIEYNDPTFYATPTNSNRAAIATPYVYVNGVSKAGTTVLTTQSFFGTSGSATNFGPSLGVGRYIYSLRVRGTTTATATTYGYVLSGTATVAFHSFQVISKLSITSALTAGTTNILSASTSTPSTTTAGVTAATTAAVTYVDLVIEGMFDVTTAGTVSHNYTQTGATVLTVLPGSFITITPFGFGAAAGAANTNIGNFA